MSIWHALSKPKGPVNARDFVSTIVFLPLTDDTFAIVATSVDDTSVPVAESVVRGEIKIGVYLYEPVAGDATRTHHQSVVLIDPKGNIPASIVNAALSNRAIFYEKLRDRIHEELN